MHQTPIRICYIDDEQTAEDYAERLSQSGTLACKLISPPKWDELVTLDREEADLFLIDYELSTVQPDGFAAAYQGSTLAADMRTRFPDYPIVLITRGSILRNLNPQTERQLKGQLQVYDELILKDKVYEELEKILHKLESLALGFRALRKVKNKTWRSLVKAMGADVEEANLLREAAPPLQKGEWIVTGAAYWIRNVLLEYPGILYDPLHAATCLGISLESFENSRVQRLLASARYTGVFSPYDGRWWKGRLLKTAKELAIEAGVDGPINQA